MPILNQANYGPPSLLVALWRAVSVLSPQTRDRLLALCAPPAAVDDKQGKAAKALNTWIGVGVFREAESSHISLADQFRHLGGSDVDGFRRALLDFLVAEEVRVGELGETETAAQDLFELAPWALMQDPYSFDPSWERVEEQLHDQRAQIINRRDPWNAYKVWAPFLGLAVNGTRSGLVLNPAGAVRNALPSVFQGVEASQQDGLAVDEFLRRLSQRLPVLDGGTCWEQVRKRVENPWRVQKDSEISPCLSLALLQLEHEGIVRLVDRSDSPSQRSLLGREGREKLRFTHVAWENGDA